MQKESNQTDQRNSNCERNEIRLLIWTKVKILFIKILCKWINRKEIFVMKIWAFESPDSDNQAKSYTKMKFESGIAIEINRGKSTENKSDKQTDERMFVV